MTMTPQTPQPGWYPDPGRGHEFRYWDGGTWADEVADHGQTSVDPIAAPDGGQAGQVAGTSEPETVPETVLMTVPNVRIVRDGKWSNGPVFSVYVTDRRLVFEQIDTPGSSAGLFWGSLAKTVAEERAAKRAKKADPQKLAAVLSSAAAGLTIPYTDITRVAMSRKWPGRGNYSECKVSLDGRESDLLLEPPVFDQVLEVLNSQLPGRVTVG